MPRPMIDGSIPITRTEGIRFGEAGGKPLLLDAVYPQGKPERPRPAVIWVHGGGWAFGTREDRWMSPYLATHSFFAISVDYRLSGEAKFAAQIHDVKAAIRWLRANADEYGVDPDHIGIWGDSAGGHLASLAGVTGDLPELEGDSGSPGYSSRVQAVAAGNSPSDFLGSIGGEMARTDPDAPVIQLFGGTVSEKEDLMRLASPIFHVGPDSPPYFIANGTLDETVPFEQGERMYQALMAAGVEAEFVPLKGRYHNYTGRIKVTDDEWRGWELGLMALSFFIKHLRS